MGGIPLSVEFALRLDRVSKSFGGLLAVDRVTLAVYPGERRALKIGRAHV